jgi:hypothetical protein
MTRTDEGHTNKGTTNMYIHAREDTHIQAHAYTHTRTRTHPVAVGSMEMKLISMNNFTMEYSDYHGKNQIETH